MRRGRRTAESRHGHGRQQPQPQAQPMPQYQPYYEPTGQRVIKHEDRQSEVQTPWEQAGKVIGCRQRRYLVISLVVLILSLITYVVIGKYAIFPISVSMVLAGCIALYKGFDWGDIEIWRLVAPLLTAGLVAAISIGAYVIHNGVVIPWQAWVFLFGLWLAGFFTYVYLVPLSAVEWRYTAEIYDPNGPTAVKQPEVRGGVRYPWTPEEKADEDRLAEIESQISQILRHVRSPQPKEVIRFIRGNGGNGRGRANLPERAMQVVPDRLFVRALTSGRRVPVDALVTFLRQSDERGTGAREWKGIWQDVGGEDMWSDVIELWEAMGVFERGRPGKSGQFTRSQEVAMAILLDSIEPDRPTLALPVQTENVTPGWIGQDSQDRRE